MFTGIIETTGLLKEIQQEEGSCRFLIESKISRELHIDQSVAHDGVCLTVIQRAGIMHEVTAVAETLEKTNLSSWATGRVINLERALKPTDRLDGHIVQGHVDTTAKCIEKRKAGEDNYLYRFQIPPGFAALIIEKGSVCINGVSLTSFDVTPDAFSVTVIPYTLHNTSFNLLSPEDQVNIEFDLIGKYILRQREVALAP